jgi:hypothetical protein
MTLAARRDLFLSYINHKTIVDLDSLSASYLQFLFFLKEITEIDPDATEELLEKSIFTPEEIETLMQTDIELREAIEHAAFLLDGIIVKIMLSMNNISLLADQNFQDIAVVRDNNWIGYTWVNLLKNPIFNINYYSKMPQLNELVYFPYYYEESIYKGQPMLNFLGESPILVSLMDMALENIKETTT